MVPAHTHTHKYGADSSTHASLYSLGFHLSFPLSSTGAVREGLSKREEECSITQHNGATRRVNAALGARALREVPAGGSGDGDNAANHCRVNVSTASEEELELEKLAGGSP